MPRIFCTTLLASCVLSFACAAQQPKLPDTVINMLRAAQIPEDAIATRVLRLSDGALVIAHNADASMQTASTIKLVTTLVGLERLGPTYRGRTELVTNAKTVNGVLEGDLVLRGLGDANLDWRAFESMLATVRNQGIAEVRGNLIIDRHFFQPPRLDVGVPPFDEAPEFRYNVIPDALLLNMNLGSFEFTSDAGAVSIRMTPALDRVTVVSGMTLIEATCSKWEDGWKSPTVARQADGSIVISINGTFPKNCAANTELNLLDRGDFVDRLFRSLWRGLGGKFSAAVNESAIVDSSVDASARVLATHRSRPLGEVVRDINKASDNTLARLLYLTLGTLPTTDKNLNSTARADEEIRAWFKRNAIKDKGLVLENGSGLSRTERITPTQMTALLTIASRSNWAPEFMASLPIAALDGTMRRRLRESAAAQQARLKTGTLNGVVALAGYVSDGTNQPCVAAAFINHPLATSKVAQPILDALVDWVTQSKTESAWALPASAYAGG
jgi:serine-type D-Ala-D-Ala carboxypeptidase/endopeptidase (penicillin-binding protein 4)